MNVNLLRILITGLLFLFIYATGFFLSRTGKPYSGILLTFHKLISLAAIVFLTVTIYRINRMGRLSLIELLAVVVSGIFFLSTIVFGGLLSAERPTPGAVSILHTVTAILTVLSTAVAFYLVYS